MADNDKPSSSAPPAVTVLPAGALPPGSPKPVHIGGESLVDRILPHIKKVLIGAVFIAVILSVVFAVRWWKHRGQETDTAKVAAVLAVGERPIVPKGDNPDPKVASTPSFVSTAERGNAVLAEITKHGATNIGHAYRGAALLDAGKLDEAIAEYRAGTSAKDLDGVLAREGLGLALEAKAAADKDPTARQKLYEESLAAFVAMQPVADGPRHAYALYHQGRLLALLGKRAEAKAAFEKAKELAAGLDLGELIEQRLASLG